MPDHYLLQWSNHLTNIAAAFSTLRQNNKLVDVTLAADGHSLQAHKVVLCACSAYFEELLSVNPCKHPIIYLKDVRHEHLSAVVEFMYSGAVYVGNEHLDDVLNLGASLRVRGMVDVKGAPRQGSNDEDKDPDTPAGKKRKRRPGLSRDNSSEETTTSQPTLMVRDPSVDPEQVAGPPPPPPPPPPIAAAETPAAEPVGKLATVPTAAERKAAPPRSYSEGDVGLKGKEGLDGEDGSSPRAKRSLLQRQPRVKRECDQPSTPGGGGGGGGVGTPVREGSGEEPRVRSPALSQPSISVETIVSDTPAAPGGSYLAVPTSSLWPVRQMSTPTPVLSPRDCTLVKQGSMPSMACAPQPSSSPVTVQKMRSTPVLSRGGSGPPAYFVVGGSSSAPLMPVVVSQSQPVPQILLTSADDQPPSERSLGCRSHAPVLRDGPAVSCSHCWNTEYSQGRTLRRKTKYMCRDCSVSLCIVPCFQEYHETVSKTPLVVSRDPNKPTTKKILPKLGSL